MKVALVSGNVEFSPAQRRTVLAAAFLGWLFAGVQLALLPLTARTAIKDLLSQSAESTVSEAVLGQWYAWLLCAFLLGAAFGGLLFGQWGDRAGRTRAMAWSILCYSFFSGACWFAQSAEQLLVLRFLASLGLGGTWPCGVALVSEAWPDASRPALAGAMGTAANVGIFLTGLVGRWAPITTESWRWVWLVGALPVILGVWILGYVPESPRWLARGLHEKEKVPSTPVQEVFLPPLLGKTLVGILLGTIPLLGAWGAGKWLIPWADAVGDNPRLKADIQAVWAFGAVLGSAAGGWLAHQLGRRTSYFLISLASLLLNFSIFRFFTPADAAFPWLVFVLGLVSTTYFGWLPLCLPELFPTRARATGSGVAYNFGRFLSAAGVLGAGALMGLFGGDYARVGSTTAWIYGLGLVVVLFAPDTRGMRD
jgi:predicted MFS family arabinose efflux permease